MAKPPKNPFADLASYRKSRGENQIQFWSRLAVTQSGGSRYESGREMPKPTAILLLAFADGLLDEATLKKLASRVEKSAGGRKSD